jgi:hypothetical protein
MSELNLTKFTECLTKYRKDCDRTLWAKNELPKFYFANLLTRRIQLRLQPAEMIREICERVEEKNYYCHNHTTRIVGIQFLKGAGSPKHSEPITASDIELFKNLALKDNWGEEDFKDKGMSYTALSGWLGTLLPIRFMPVTSTLFRHTISYLFDLDLKMSHKDDYDYFLASQKYFYLTKRRLRELNLDSIYLKEIAEYVKFNYPKSMPKTKYDEYDLNWLTQDFHLYIYREILRLDTGSKISVSDRRPEKAKAMIPGFQSPAASRLYVP